MASIAEIATLVDRSARELTNGLERAMNAGDNLQKARDLFIHGTEGSQITLAEELREFVAVADRELHKVVMNIARLRDSLSKFLALLIRDTGSTPSTVTEFEASKETEERTPEGFVPQGFSERQFKIFARGVRQLAKQAGLPKGDLVLQVSRIRYQARLGSSDVDIALRVTDETFFDVAEKALSRAS